MDKKIKFPKSLVLVSLIQSLALAVYFCFAGLFMLNGNKWFGSMPNILGPILFLTFFAVSALFCGLVTFGFPFYLVWEKKQTKNAIRVVLYTLFWLLLFLVTILLFLS